MSNSKSIESSYLSLEVEKISTLLLRFAIPAITSTVVLSIYNIVDRVFIGHGVGPMAISGLALTLPLMSFVTAIGTLVGAGASARVSIVLGMKDIPWVQKILGNSIVMTFALSAILVSISMIWLDEILIAFGGSEQTIPYAKEYLKVVIPGSIFSNLTFNFASIMRAAGHPRNSMFVIVLGAVLNVILDPILIFWFDLGIAGAAWATVISMFIGSIFALGHFFNKKRPVHFSRSSLKLEKRIMYNIFSIGLSPFLVNAVAACVNIIMNNLLYRHGGDLAIGAFGIINSFLMFMVMLLLGLSQGMQPIAGYNYGARHYDRVKAVLWLTVRCGIIFCTLFFICTTFFPRYLVSAFTSDETLISMSATGLRICAILTPLVAIPIIIGQFCLSISKALQSIILSLSRQIIFLIPAVYVGAYFWGLNGVWYGFASADICAITVSLLTYFHVRNKYLSEQTER